jgi:hypothetical protein
MRIRFPNILSALALGSLFLAATAEAAPRYYRPRPADRPSPYFYAPYVLYGPGWTLGAPGCRFGGPWIDYARGPYHDFGPFTGARHDEDNLLHLGGQGPYAGTPDIIDLIEGRPGFRHP